MITITVKKIFPARRYCSRNALGKKSRNVYFVVEMMLLSVFSTSSPCKRIVSVCFSNIVPLQTPLLYFLPYYHRPFRLPSFVHH